MINKLKRLALWLGLVDVVDESREAQQRLDQLMIEMSSAATWLEYMRIRGYASDINNPARTQETQ
jgi:hypothetical protein